MTSTNAYTHVRTVSLFIALMGESTMAGCSSATSFTSTVTSATVKTKMDEAGIVGTKLGPDPATPIKPCDMYMKMETFDELVYSEDVCIKYTGEPISMPTRIALSVRSYAKADRSAYCDDTSYKGENICVWNNVYSDKHPFKFRFFTTGNIPMSSYISLMRVLRNGKKIYSWDVRQVQPATTEIKIDSSVIRQPEYFREPVSLGFFLLTSGADVAKIAAEQEYDVAQTDWRKSLEDALKKTNPAQLLVPSGIRLAAKCYDLKLEYLRRSVAQEPTDEVRTGIRELNERIKKRNSAIERLREGKGRLHVSFEQASYRNRAPTSIDGVRLSPNDRVLFIRPDGTKAEVLVFTTAGAPWTNLISSDLQALPQVEGSSDRVIKVELGKRAGSVFLLKSWNDPAAEIEVEEIARTPSCDDPNLAVENFNALMRREIDAAVTSQDSRDAENVVTKAALISSQLRDSVDKNRQYMRQAIQALPEATQEDIRKDLVWFRTIEDTSAQLINAAEQLRSVGPALKKQLVSNLRDPAVHLRTYEAFASNLQSDASIFSPAHQNPEPGEGEKLFPMTFKRPVQTYRFLAWNAVPLPIAKNAAIKVEPRVDYLIPIIDIYGRFYQTGWHTPATTGFGLGLLGSREEIERRDGTSYVTAFNLGAQANWSLGTFRVGLAYMIREANRCDRDDTWLGTCFIHQNNFRVLVGADLIRLFTGSDAAAEKKTADTEASATSK